MTVVAITVAAVADAIAPKLIFIAVLTFSVLAILRQWSPLRRLLIWILVFLVPLLVVHGLVNPNYPATWRIFEIVPLRQEGIAFAVDTALILSCLFLPALCWFHVNQDAIVRFFNSLHLPPTVLAILFQAISVVHQIESRAKSILLAQKARGIDVSGGPVRRVKGLIPVVLPLTVWLLKEAPLRAAVQDFTCSPRTLTLDVNAKVFSTKELLIIATSLLVYCSILFLWGER